MSIEPTEQEYEALGREVLQRARGRARRRRGAQFLAVGAAAAMVSVVATTALLGSPSGGPQQEAFEQPGGGYTVTCFSDQGRGDAATDAVTIRRASGGDEPADRLAVAECGRVWQAGVLGVRVTGQSAGPSVEFQGPQDSSAESAESTDPRLQACPQSDGSIAVLPDPDALAARLCDAFGEEERP